MLGSAQYLGVCACVKNKSDGSVLVFTLREEAKLNTSVEAVSKPEKTASLGGLKRIGAHVELRLRYLRIRFDSTGKKFREGFGGIVVQSKCYRNGFSGFKDVPLIEGSVSFYGMIRVWTMV